MKKIALLIALLPLAIGAMAQRTVETVYLKNGGLVKGEIIEQVPGQSLKVKTKDGSVFVYQMDEVERIAKESQTDDSDGQHPGLDFSVDLGYNINTKGGGGSLAAELELGKRFNKNFYLGIGSGAYIPTADGDPLIPITANARVIMPISGSKISPFVGLKAGYVLNTADDINMGYGVTAKMPDYIMVQIMPGFQYALSDGIDFNFGAGYTHFLPTSGSYNFGAIAIRAGFGFHKTGVVKKEKKTKRSSIPTRDKGFQLTLEGGKMGFGGDEYDGFLGDLVLSYKLNPNLSVGIGGGVDVVDTYDEEGVWESTVYSDGREFERTSRVDVGITTAKAFVRGQYRLTDKRLSPFASCDAGLRFYSYDPYIWDDLYEGESKPSSTVFFVSPAIGLSLRTFNNSYLELKAGYSLAPGGGTKNVEETSGDGRYTYKSTYEWRTSFSAPYVTLGWTHTFGSRKR